MADTSGFIRTLVSDRPAADRADKMGLYGWLIGDWVFVHAPTVSTAAAQTAPTTARNDIAGADTPATVPAGRFPAAKNGCRVAAPRGWCSRAGPNRRAAAADRAGRP